MAYPAAGGVGGTDFCVRASHPNGEHTVVEADGQAFGWATVRVTTVGEGTHETLPSPGDSLHTSRTYCMDAFRLYLHLEGRSFAWPQE